MGAGGYGDVVFGDVDAYGEALGVYVGEVVLGLFWVFVGDIEADVVEGMHFHLVVDGACYDVAWRKAESLVVFLHELLAVGQAEDAAVAAHGLCYEVGWVGLRRIVQHGGVELHELHVFDFALGTVDHGYAVACGNVWIGGGGVDGSCAASGHECDLGEIGVYLACCGIEDIGSVALDVGCAACHSYA